MKSFTRNKLSAAIVTIGLYTMAPTLYAQEYAPEISSARQESRIDTTYELNRYLRDYAIDVSVTDGRATLVGIVDEDITKDLAEEIALGVPGITSVDNQIEIQADRIMPAHDAEKRSFGETVDDASITAAVKSKLLWSSHTDGLDTQVNTVNGAVTLKGTAHSDESIALAQMLAENTYGVSSVDNQLTVSPEDMNTEAAAGNGATQAISDTWITTKVKSTFIMSNNVSSRDISVSTKDGIVSLAGKTNSGAERDLAIALAKNIRGVQSVNADAFSF